MPQKQPAELPPTTTRVTEKEYVDILRDIIIFRKIKGKKQIAEILENLIRRCIANKQPCFDLWNACLEKVLSSKEYELAAIAEKEKEEAQERLRRKTEFVS